MHVEITLKLLINSFSFPWRFTVYPQNYVKKEKIIREKQAGKLMLISSHILSDLDELSTEVIYIFEGKVQYNNAIEVLKEETGEKRLGRAIACMISQKELLASVNE